ncbi:DUF6538 domain-containing protein [Ochrobactrum teleogrylli]|uniref:Integrase n=1 Tax=Ochrobactrum teleogrylli TaxID=2479765 RepID=A0ABY2Y8W8_9HYPH|nr:DUF6538 domain-containing protein [[Ochrobactrum] teleogrylli]TNV18374.1 hypothetical protein FIC94_01810 [[Ochrobactrum] teleogrylli]
MKRVSKDIPYLYLRGGTYVFRRYVPPEYRVLAKRPEFKKTLETKDYDEALARYARYKKKVDADFERLKRNMSLDDDKPFDFYADEALTFGRRNIDLQTLRENPVELQNRLKQFNAKNSADPDVFLTYINASAGKVRMSELVGVYEEEQAIALSTRSKRERSVHLNALKNAAKKFEEHLNADKFLEDVTRADAKSFHKMLTARVLSQDTSGKNKKITENTASKYITHLRVLINEYYKKYDIEKDTVFAGLTFGKKTNKRPKIPVEFIKANWFKDDAFVGLNDCAKHLLFAVLDTGCNLKELCGLDAKSEIVLDHKIPHLVIQANDNRGLKAEARFRTMPLVGKALEAFQAFPTGFTRYANDSGHATASATINKFLRENHLVEHDKQTLYGLRHTFKDRLRKHKTNEELSHDLMGHKYKTMADNYGDGYELEAKYEVMKLLSSDWD